MINLTRNILKSDKLFDRIADELDISPSLYKTAVDHYTAIGNWLDEINLTDVFEGSEDPIPEEKIKADIFPQGSFALGTVVKPWRNGEEQEYDIDLVFQLDLKVGTKQAYALKKAVGQRLKNHGSYSQMLKEEGKRCWTIAYAEHNNIQFHLDILPALNGQGISRPPYQNSEISISDKINSNLYQWLPSNPRGYAEWFKGINIIAFKRIEEFERKRVAGMEAISAIVHDVPDYFVRTPLQRAIQILKRHRDVRFNCLPNEKEKPISMIITTLAALSYDNEESISFTLENIINKLLSYKNLLINGYTPTKMHKLIELTADRKWIIRNPVCLEENFADKWHLDEHKRAKAFFQWLDWLEQDMVALVEQMEQAHQKTLLEEIFGSRVAAAVAPLTASTGASSLLISNVHTGDIVIDSPAQPWRCEA